MTDNLFRVFVLFGVTASLFALADIRLEQQETLRLLKRGDKIDCRLSDMKGTMP